MVREAVMMWLQIKPVTTEFNNTTFFKVLKDIQKIYQEIIDSPKIQKKTIRFRKKTRCKRIRND